MRRAQPVAGTRGRRTLALSDEAEDHAPADERPRPRAAPAGLHARPRPGGNPRLLPAPGRPPPVSARRRSTPCSSPLRTRQQENLALEPRIRVDPRPSHASGRAPAASHEEFAALLRTTKTARDRCMVALLGAYALRVGQVVGLLREDIHLVPAGSTVPGCPYSLSPHLHLKKRDGHPRGAANKNRGTVVVPVPGPVVMLYADWMRERLTIPGAGKAIWAFVSLPGPTGEPGGQVLGTRRVQDLVSDLARDAGIRHIHPHMLRHTFGETAADLDVACDVLQRLLSHRDVASQNVYRNPSNARVAHAAQAVNDKIFGPA
ncbi:tyrosine-type recombinase/integrase [Streptomyces sp. NPDC020800]|uniref:tyrosine-type recombinase/integrase n=1 Tax=Streptomyces sp. NPDC020800 TaxID=3365092 RepID=UPI0037A4C203